jgi:iron complex outermembrane recepter protein
MIQMNLIKCIFSIIILNAIASNLSAADKLEEVVVTAQKRTESKSDLPVSITVFNDKYIEKMGIKKIEDLPGFTENVHFTESGVSTQVRIRGIGSGNSQGFEQSVYG